MLSATAASWGNNAGSGGTGGYPTTDVTSNASTREGGSVLPGSERFDTTTGHAADDALSADTNSTMTVTDDLMTEGGVPLAANRYASFTTVDRSALPPKIDQWERNMVDYGHRWGQALQAETDYLKLFKLRYYDAQLVHERIGAYLDEAEPWRDYGQKAESNYKQYLEKSDFLALGYERFPHGLYLDWKRTGDTESRKYLEYLRDRPPFSDPSGREDEWARQKYSREIAYSIQSQIVAERAGNPRQTERLTTLVELALGHIDIWVTGDYVDSDPAWQFCQAFMTGLTASALIEYHRRQVERGDPDPRILPAIERVAGFIWNEMWVADVDGTGYGAFEYVQPAVPGVGGESPAPDLNLLIAPMFSWLYLQTGNAKWLQRGDDVFAGGVELANLNTAKNFNQNYRSSFDFVEWRVDGVRQHDSR